jgi:hypothetical protein
MAFGTLKRAIDVMSPVIVASAAVVVVWAQVESRWVHPDRQQLADVNGLHIDASRIRHAKGGGSIALVESTDYECPCCAQHALRIASLIDEDSSMPAAYGTSCSTFRSRRFT